MYQLKNGTPCAFITKDRQRLKQNGLNVYLKNGEEFEIELFNPSQSTVLSKIKINGNYLSGGGLVLKPGQRIFLERYLDDAKKFKFETYEVDGTSNEVLNAIANNGDVIIEFYEEYVNVNPYYLTNYGTVTLGNNSGNGISIPTYTTAGFGVGSTSTYTSNVSFTSSPNTVTYSSNSHQGPNIRGFAKKSIKKDVETGRIEKGSNSDQSFTYVDKTFNQFTVSTSFWKILPSSQMRYESNDLKVYCGNCGTKRKKDSYKFCPTCGHKY